MVSVLCCSSTSNHMEDEAGHQSGWPRPADVGFYHHRLDLDPPNSMCSHFASPATLEAGSLYLTPYAYSAPHSHFFHLTTSDQVRSVLDQFQGSQQRSPSPDLIRPDVRAEIRTIAAKITPLWKNTSYNSVLNNFIVRR